MLAIFKERFSDRLPTEYYEYLSQFHNGLLLAIKDNNVNESHLFGLFFAVIFARDEYGSGCGTMSNSYLPIFCAAMEYLLRQTPILDGKFLPQYIWWFMLSYLRRISMGQDVTEMTQHSDAQFHYMQILDHTLRINYKIGNGINRFLSSGGDCSQDRDFSLYWDVNDILASLEAKFRIAFRYQSRLLKVLDTDEEFCLFIQSVSSRNGGFENLGYLDNAFKVILIKVSK